MDLEDLEAFLHATIVYGLHEPRKAMNKVSLWGDDIFLDMMTFARGLLKHLGEGS